MGSYETIDEGESRDAVGVRTARLALVAVAIVALLAVTLARRSSGDSVVESLAPTANSLELPVGRPAPPMMVGEWINTDPLAVADLDGKVVLYNFWTFGCINCKRTLPYVKAWFERYAADGLVVIGVHTPEFDYEADPANVRDFVEAEGITYPVALDPDKKVWRLFDNHAWPGFFLHDRNGFQRHFHAGEGRYALTEDAIRLLLGVDPASPRAEVPG